jgi:hypothetical protein
MRESPAIEMLRAQAAMPPQLDAYGDPIGTPRVMQGSGGASASASAAAPRHVGSGPNQAPGESWDDWRERMAYEAELQAAADRRRADLEAEAFTRERGAATEDEQRRRGWAESDRAANQAYIDRMLAQVGGTGGGGGGEFDEAAYRAAFARAKDRGSRAMSGSMAALKNAMSSRGLAGSGMEAEGMAEIVGGGAANMGEFLRDQAMEEFGARERAQTRALTARGQTLGLIPSLAGLLNQGLRY